jgi:hypothetical protein
MFASAGEVVLRKSFLNEPLTASAPGFARAYVEWRLPPPGGGNNAA